MKLRNKGKLTREFDTGDLVVVREQVKPSIKYWIYQTLVFKTKVPYIVLEKDTPSSCWVQIFPFCEGLGRTGRKVKESAARTEKIPYTMVTQKNVDGADIKYFMSRIFMHWYRFQR